MNLKQRKLHLITYDIGPFDLAKFEPVSNIIHVKPKGGLWASPVKTNWGWFDWSKSEGFSSLSSSFKFQYTGNILKIDSLRDAMEMPWSSPYDGLFYPDFEAMIRQGVDAIWLTVHGEHATRFSRPYSLYGWDCESVLIMNPNGITLD